MLKNDKAVTFVHPAEEMLARIMDYYGVTWQYEPKTLDLEWNEQGKVTLAFTPDFYLPDQDLYIELTTLRPNLSAKKNKKMRLMQELHPEVQIKLMKRRDMRDMMVKYVLYDEAQQIQGTESQKKGA